MGGTSAAHCSNKKNVEYEIASELPVDQGRAD